MKNEINFKRIDNDFNDNPRYVCHFLNFIIDDDYLFTSLDKFYSIACKRANKLGGKKFHNKKYGGGIVFKSYNINDLTVRIITLRNTNFKI